MARTDRPFGSALTVALGALALVSFHASPATAVTRAIGGAPPPSLVGNTAPRFPAARPDRVEVVASGLPYRGAIPVVVGNGSAAPVTVVRVSAEARTASGQEVGRTSARELVPVDVPAGGLAIGAVPVPATPRAGVTYSFTVASRRGRGRGGSTGLAITDTRLGPPLTGTVAQRLTGVLHNPLHERTRGPAMVTVLCVDEAGKPAGVVQAEAARGGIAPDGAAPFAVDFADLCPAYLAGARVALAPRDAPSSSAPLGIIVAIIAATVVVALLAVVLLARAHRSKRRAAAG